MTQEWACAYTITGTAKSWPQTYWTQDTAHYMMSDHLIGAASWYGFDSPLFLVMGELEGGGSGSNWMQMGTTAVCDTLKVDQNTPL